MVTTKIVDGPSLMEQYAKLEEIVTGDRVTASMEDVRYFTPTAITNGTFN